MTTRTTGIFLLGLAFLLLGSALGMAGGIGVYGAYDVLAGSIGWYDNFSNFDRVKIIQLGLLFDTAMARDRLFNYRLQLGVDVSTASYFDSDLAQTVSMDIWQIYFINSFGFGLVREEFLRLWVGPQVGFSLGFQPSYSQSAYYGAMSDFFEFSIFAGLVLGVNINLGDSLSLCADVGVRLNEDVMASPGAAFGGFLIKPFADVGVVLRLNDTYEN